MTCESSSVPDEQPVVNHVPVYGMFETCVTNTTGYANPFANVDLRAVFVSPSGRDVRFLGFYDGNGKGGQVGTLWKQRFMPDEAGTWSYTLTFTDGSPGKTGSFECVAEGAKPGPWKQDPDNTHWFRAMRGERFLPVALYADCPYTPIDWQDAIRWCVAKEYNTLVTSTMNTWAWADEWENVTAFATADASTKTVDYDRLNLKMWQEWDDLLETAGENGIYIGPFNGPHGFYGGRRWKYPPVELAYSPARRDGFNTSQNRRLMRYLVARQGAYWNLAYWNLGDTELYWYGSEAQAIDYGEYFASITPFERMITAQDAEQVHDEDRRWLSKMDCPSGRKLNTVQTAVGNPNRPGWSSWEGKSHIDDPAWQNAGPNNELALDSYAGFPVLTTEGLWEGQGRAEKPLRIIWGFFTAGAHTMWADWRNDDGIDGGRWSSLGRAWTPVKPLAEHLFQLDQLGVDCVGDEQLLIATAALQALEYWKMNPHNELVAGSAEAYCLAEPDAQYLIYAPNGGEIRIDLSSFKGTFVARWLDPRDGGYSEPVSSVGNYVRTFTAPTPEDWVLIVTYSTKQTKG